MINKVHYTTNRPLLFKIFLTSRSFPYEEQLCTLKLDFEHVFKVELSAKAIKQQRLMKRQNKAEEIVLTVPL